MLGARDSKNNVIVMTSRKGGRKSYNLIIAISYLERGIYPLDTPDNIHEMPQHDCNDRSNHSCYDCSHYCAIPFQKLRLHVRIGIHPSTLRNKDAPDNLKLVE